MNATSKLVKAWESKNAKNAAKAGGVSLMALSLAACGGSDSTITQAQLDAQTAAATAAAAAQAAAEAEAAAAAAAQAAAEADAATAAEAQAAAEAAQAAAEAEAAAAAVAQAAAEAAEAALKTPVVDSFKVTTAETLNGGAGNDTFTGSGTFYTDADKINDIYSNDADTANLTVTGDITPDVTGVEAVNLTVNSTAAKTVTVSSMAGVDTLTLTRGDVTVGDAVIAGNKAHDIDALDASDISAVVIAGTATNVALDQANTSGVALNANVATGDVTVVGAGTINASGAGTGDTVTVTAMTTAQAGGTAAGETAANANAVVVNTGAETVSIANGGGSEEFDGTISVTGATTKNVTIAAATGGATVNVLGETGTLGTDGVVVKGIDDSGASITTSYVGLTTAKGVIEIDGTTGTTDAATIAAAGVTTLHTLESGGNQVETVNLSGNGAAVTYEITGAATTYNITGSQDVTLSGNESSVDGKTVTDSSTGTSTLKITTLDDSDLSKVSVDNILVSSNVASKTLTLGDNATVTLGTDVTTAFAVAGKKADYTVNLATGDDTAASGAVIDITTGTLTASSNVKSLNIDATVGKLTVATATTAATTTDITISGTKDVDLGGVTAKSVVSTSTGKIGVDASATSLVTVTTGAGVDTIVMDQAAKVTVSSGAGDDVVTAGASAESSYDLGEGDDQITISNANAIVVNAGAGDDAIIVNDTLDTDAIIVGGDGTDTLTFNEDTTGDMSANSNFAISGIEKIDVTAGGVTISSAQFAGDNSFQLLGNAATADVLAITNVGTAGATIDASNVTFAATQGAYLNLTGKAALKDVITGSAKNDTITVTTGGDVIDGGAGTDTLVAGNMAANNIDGGTSDSVGMVLNLGSTAVTASEVVSKISTFTADTVTSVGGGEMVYTFASSGATNSALVSSVTSVELVTGTTGADYVVASTAGTTFTGNAGADYFVSGASADTVVIADIANVKSTADTTIGFTSADNIQIQATAAGQMGTLHDSDGDAFTGAATGVVSTVNIAGGAADLATADANVISINANTASLTTGYASYAALQTAMDGAEQEEATGSADFSNGDELVAVYYNTTTSTYDVGIITVVGGDGLDGGDDTWELLLSVDSTGVTQAEVAASIDFIA
jgi:Ca2+-binding RTX toxin-like protein